MSKKSGSTLLAKRQQSGPTVKRRKSRARLMEPDADKWLLVAEEQIMCYDRDKAIKFCGGLKRWCERIKPEGVKADLLFQAGYALSIDNSFGKGIRAGWLDRWRASEVRAEIERRILEGKL